MANRSYAFWLKQHAEIHGGSATVISDANLMVIGHTIPNEVRAKVAADIVAAMRAEKFDPTCEGNLREIAEEFDSDLGALIDGRLDRMRDPRRR